MSTYRTFANEWRSREVTRTASGRIFHGIRCCRCKTILADERGNPRWDVVDGMRFVCRDSCPGRPS